MALEEYDLGYQSMQLGM